ncbi:hypothetical protein GCK72_011130 [Caenorhabditis remanei]|uniref:Uncharacterized protein n=1 Tax=Caenorhabditis remanei TaxID=31234 RepID=A0A6A5H6P9_CAERE|nr:hypothetical protein GCK72_011130 [Caenorhabditis remanei]KAF1762867.1 hypothetical protein GCK72_011130 [Caenorhabditis remanei]
MRCSVSTKFEEYLGGLLDETGSPGWRKVLLEVGYSLSTCLIDHTILKTVTTRLRTVVFGGIRFEAEE